MPLKTACPHCSAKLVLKQDRAPVQVKCPKCQQRFQPPSGDETQVARGSEQDTVSSTVEPIPRAESPPRKQKRNPNDLMRDVVNAFRGQVVHRRPTWGYRLALLLSAFGLCLLIVAYFACMAGLGYGLYLYATRVVPPSMQIRGRAVIIAVVMHAGVLLAGAALLYALVAPLFNWTRSRPEGRLLDASAHPVLHCFVRALCTLIGAPLPAEIRLDPTPNAAAGRYGGLFGLVGGRLVLVIGEPLFRGLKLRALAGIIAHELGHFSQAKGGLLLRYIANVTNWFQEATVRTSAIRESIGEHGDEAEGSAKILVMVASGVTGLGKLLLLQFALLSRMMTFYLMRQQEFDADRYEAEVAGSAQFALTFERLIELQAGFQKALVSLLEGTIPPEDIGALGVYVVDLADGLSESERNRAARMMSPQRSQWFDSHPSPTERIAAVARQPFPGIFQLSGRASSLLNLKALENNDEE